MKKFAFLLFMFSMIGCSDEGLNSSSVEIAPSAPVSAAKIAFDGQANVTINNDGSTQLYVKFDGPIDCPNEDNSECTPGQDLFVDISTNNDKVEKIYFFNTQKSDHSSDWLYGECLLDACNDIVIDANSRKITFNKTLLNGNFDEYSDQDYPDAPDTKAELSGVIYY